jgi:hypothetical protein
MDTAGNPREGWMALIPLTVMLLIVMYIVGGPREFINLVAQWSEDVVQSVGNWVQHL